MLPQWLPVVLLLLPAAHTPASVSVGDLQPGFARFIISPEPVGDLKAAKGEYLSLRGRIASSWKIDGEQP